MAGIRMAGMRNAQIGFADALQRVSSDDGGQDLEFRGWIRHDPRCNGTSVTLELSQSLALGNGFIEAIRLIAAGVLSVDRGGAADIASVPEAGVLSRPTGDIALGLRVLPGQSRPTAVSLYSLTPSNRVRVSPKGNQKVDRQSDVMILHIMYHEVAGRIATLGPELGSWELR